MHSVTTFFSNSSNYNQTPDFLCAGSFWIVQFSSGFFSILIIVYSILESKLLHTIPRLDI